MTDYLQVTTTAAKQADAARIADVLVQRRLAACVQIVGPIRSTYRWQGQVNHDEEWLCTAKTRRDLFDPLRQAILSAHPYDVPEIIATPIEAGHGPYLDWMQQELTETSD